MAGLVTTGEAAIMVVVATVAIRSSLAWDPSPHRFRDRGRHLTTTSSRKYQSNQSLIHPRIQVLWRIWRPFMLPARQAVIFAIIKEPCLIKPRLSRNSASFWSRIAPKTTSSRIVSSEHLTSSTKVTTVMWPQKELNSHASDQNSSTCNIERNKTWCNLQRRTESRRLPSFLT